jgi:hypothetical protein
MRRILLFLALFIVNSFIIHAQSENTFNISFGGCYGIFKGTEEFTNIYSGKVNPFGGFFALGYGDYFVIGKYQKLKASGSSKVENLPVEGKADWKQEYASVGIRYHQQSTGLFVDLLYFFTRAQESISTQPIEIPELASNFSVEDRGLGLACGWAPQIVGPLGIFFEIQYSSMFKNEKTPSGGEIPNLGGLLLSAGILLTI